MAIVYSTRVIEIAVIQSFIGRPVVNVWHMYNDSEMWGDNPEAAVEDFRDNWQDHMTEMSTSDLVIDSFEWRSLDPADNRLGTVEPDTGKPLTGQVVGNSAPPNVAYLIKKNTANRPRGRRDGRSFICGVPETYVANSGALEGTTATVINGFLSSFYNGISDSSVNWAGDSYPVVLETTPASRAPGTNPVTIGSRRVTSITCDPVVSTQRDRLR